ncbi:hypothetical protein [Bradyrhizobium sp. 76]|uniref:hypothetical protein n=1 Tax=Bradyrhizobium sp. 76 TaxID=2782680 RepID=UPI00320A5E8E
MFKAFPSPGYRIAYPREDSRRRLSLNASSGISYNKFWRSWLSVTASPNVRFFISPKMGPAFVETFRHIPPDRPGHER